MGAGRRAEVWAGWLTVAKKFAGALRAVLPFGFLLRGPAPLQPAAAWLAEVGVIVALRLSSLGVMRAGARLERDRKLVVCGGRL